MLLAWLMGAAHPLMLGGHSPLLEAPSVRNSSGFQVVSLQWPSVQAPFLTATWTLVALLSQLAFQSPLNIFAYGPSIITSETPESLPSGPHPPATRTQVSQEPGPGVIDLSFLAFKALVISTSITGVLRVPSVAVLPINLPSGQGLLSMGSDLQPLFTAEPETWKSWCAEKKGP
ncbi:hypothetical protein H920_00146 [Fukomys damarensis]|uniref:Uncharacterized protein n=1 Tax=Fukomys damarensis TaxID=885580 RepID=A0A091E551_FUKDA|nr:hypothetical protein H920_00146 [Fukomys damarensis]